MLKCSWASLTANWALRLKKISAKATGKLSLNLKVLWSQLRANGHWSQKSNSKHHRSADHSFGATSSSPMDQKIQASGNSKRRSTFHMMMNTILDSMWHTTCQLWLKDGFSLWILQRVRKIKPSGWELTWIKMHLLELLSNVIGKDVPPIIPSKRLLLKAPQDSMELLSSSAVDTNARWAKVWNNTWHSN